MTLDEAIKHAEEVAEENRNVDEGKLDLLYCGDTECIEAHKSNCIACAEEHEQLANWLKELKQLREQEHCEDAVSRQALIERINNAEENFKIDHMESIASDDGDAFVDGVLSGVFNILEMVAQAPSVTPTRKVGKWIKSNIGGAKVCSVCNAHMGLSAFKFCPNCGAKMETEE